MEKGKGRCCSIFFTMSQLHPRSSMYSTIPVKCKLTVAWNSNNLTQCLILKTQKLQVSSFESSLLSFKSRIQRNKGLIYLSILCCRCFCCSLLLLCIWEINCFPKKFFAFQNSKLEPRNSILKSVKDQFLSQDCHHLTGIVVCY